MSPELGVVLLYLSLIAALYAVFASLRAAKTGNERLLESARNALMVVWPLLTLTALLLITLLVRGDFHVKYVWSVSNLAMPTYLKVTALWGSQAGSILFWAWLMSTFTALAMGRNWQRERTLMPYVIAISAGTLAFFLALVTIWENPFTTFWQPQVGEVGPALFGFSSAGWAITQGFAWLGKNAPGLIGVVFNGIAPFSPPPGSVAFSAADGQGLNPLLRHFGMIIHPPMLYLGFVGFVIPYAFGMAALITRDTSPTWIHITRRWTIVAWLFLSLGLILGGRWAYDVLGWGGFWGWDPVENAAFMPWLTGTAFLHSVMIQEKRGMMRRWNILLIILTYLQVILGTFLTRSGVLSSVHSFAQSAIGPLFMLFVSGALIGSVWLLINRWEDLRADRPLDSLLSRETLFLLNNFVFVSINFAVAIGTFWPLVTEILSDYTSIEKSSVGPGYYNAVTAPIFGFMLLLMGIAPLVSWGRASLKHLGRALLWPAAGGLIGMAGLAAFDQISKGAVRIGPAITLGIIVLAFLVTVLEFHRGALARVNAQKESYLAALRALIGRNRRRYGGYVIHIGILVMGLGILGSYAYQTETQQTVAAGQTVTLGNYVLEYQGLERFAATDNRWVTRVNAVVYQNGQEVARLSPRIDTYDNGERMTIPATYITPDGGDFYALLVAWETVDLSSATIKIYYNPLINLVWSGGLIFIVGALIAAWPDFAEARESSASFPAPSSQSRVSSD
jgi:cytochrome c-type biogenesis protein CcmF